MKNCSVRSIVVWLLMCTGVCFLASGCANRSDIGAGASRAEMITDSDESAERKRARNRTELAGGYLELGKPAIALDEIKQAIIADPTFMEAYSVRGLIYMRLNDYAVAEESFSKALSISPKNSNVLHNLGWLKCNQADYPQAFDLLTRALADPLYGERAKTYRILGLCQERAGMLRDAESSLIRSYEYDASNPITGYNLANVLFMQKEFVRAQFYIRRLNNSELANAESFWLGIRIEQRLANSAALAQLGAQLEKRFPQSPELALYRRGAFNE